MTESVAIVDLFSGPGGLAEGFAAYRDSSGRPRFNIVLSVEMEPTAYRTLLLRGFLRKFPSGFPVEYYDFLNGDAPLEPDWANLYPREWQEACDETRCLTLGTSDANSFVRRRVDKIRVQHGGRTVLLGGIGRRIRRDSAGSASSAARAGRPWPGASGWRRPGGSISGSRAPCGPRPPSRRGGSPAGRSSRSIRR